MTQRKHFAGSRRAIASIIEHKTRGIVSRGGNLVLFPKLPIGRKEIGNLKGSPIESSVIRNVPANDSVPAIRGDFNRTPYPVLPLQAALVSNRNIFWAPHNLIVASQVWS